MDQVREVCSAGSALRKAAALRVRLPLPLLEVAVPDPAALSGFEEVVARELNVREVRFVAADSEEAAAHGLTSRLTVHARVAGPRLGKDVQQAIKGSKSGDWSVADDGTVTSGGIALQEGEFTLEQVAGASGGTEIAVLPRGGFVALDTTVTPELEAEGLARDVVRGVQQARRDAGLSVSDRIVLHVDGDAAVLDAVRIHEALVAGETLATSVHLGDLPEGTSIDVTGASARVAVARA
jgi:isoleucyl-tRNA synthetase